MMYSLYTKVTLLNVVMYTIGGLTIALCAAAIFVLAFELPFTRVEKILVCFLYFIELILSRLEKC